MQLIWGCAKAFSCRTPDQLILLFSIADDVNVAVAAFANESHSLVVSCVKLRAFSNDECNLSERI